jgi:predicted unusual protein kinase regulating ubiquinone biosynthesis (AarF/ABC1/UbiB family)
MPVGAASLGQLHLARVAENHNEVVVKVLRPGIDILVETDSAAISLAIGWLKRYRRSLPPRTLPMENVSYIKVSDFPKISSTGINPADVAKKIYNFYLQQIFETHFVHADPHPDNIFIKPLPTKTERDPGNNEIRHGDLVEYQRDQPFKLVFVDFGMVTEIPSRLQSALREYVIGVGARDAFRIVQSYVQAGTLLPGADLKRLEEVHQALLNRFFGGADAWRIKGVFLAEAESLLREYRDLIYDAPFQFQADMLFATRAVATLSGIATNFDETSGHWQEIVPFAVRLAADELRLNWREFMKDIFTLSQAFYKLLKSVNTIITQAERGDLSVKSSLAPDSRKLLVPLEKSINKLPWTIISVGLLNMLAATTSFFPKDM